MHYYEKLFTIWEIVSTTTLAILISITAYGFFRNSKLDDISPMSRSLAILLQVQGFCLGFITLVETRVLTGVPNQIFACSFLLCGVISFYSANQIIEFASVTKPMPTIQEKAVTLLGLFGLVSGFGNVAWLLS